MDLRLLQHSESMTTRALDRTPIPRERLNRLRLIQCVQCRCNLYVSSTRQIVRMCNVRVHTPIVLISQNGFQFGVRPDAVMICMDSIGKQKRDLARALVHVTSKIKMFALAV